MFRVLLALTLFGTLAPAAAGQVFVCQFGSTAGWYNPALDAPPTAYADTEFKRIAGLLCPTGCGTSLYAQNPTVPNAMTQVFGPGQSKISYNWAFLNQVYQSFGQSASFAIVAHEIGHHIDYMQVPPTWMDQRWDRELRADAWSGCALARSGMTTRQIEAATFALAAYPGPSHPAWNLRIPALRMGFVSCGGNQGQARALEGKR